MKELKFKSKKASQKTDISIKIVKKNVDIISHFLYHNFNDSLAGSTFLLTPIHKNDDKTIKVNYHTIGFLPNQSKVYKDLCTTKSFHILMQCFPSFNVDF